MFIAEVTFKAVAKAFKVIFHILKGTAFGKCFIHVPPQHIPMGELAGVPYPIFLFIAVKFMALNNGFVSCGTDGIGDFAKLQPIPDTVTELLAVYKGNTIDNKMVVDVIGIKVGSDYHLIPCSPHLPCGFHSDGVCFGWCDLACGKTLIPVISDIFTTFTEAALYGNHFVIGVVLGTVDGRYKHRLVGFIIVLHIADGGIQIFIKIFFGGGFVRIVGVVDYFL